MTGKHKGIITLVRFKNSAIITIYCFDYRKALVEKTIKEKMSKVLNDIIKIINYIKTRPLKTRFFLKLFV